MLEPRWHFQFPWRTSRQIHDEFEEELAFHRDMRVAELVHRGVPRDDAIAMTTREFGDVDDARRYVRAVDRGAESVQRRRDLMRALATDVTRVLRRLRRTPLFTTTAVLTLALGIGACALMFNVMTGVLLAPLPYKNADRVVAIWTDVPQVDLGFPEQPTSGAYFRDLRKNVTQFEAIAAFRANAFNLAGNGAPRRFDGIQATGQFFDAIGVSPEIGRFFTPDNELAGDDHVVVLSDELWRDTFGADRNVVGRVVTLDAEPYTVIGVAPRGFAFPHGADMPGDFQFPTRAQLWVPLDPPPDGPSDLAIVGRMKRGVTLDGARADLDHARDLEDRLIPAAKGWFGLMAVSLRTQLVGSVEPMLFTLLAAVVLLLLLACVNTAQLQLAQLQARRRELAIRAALGASARRLAMELAIEVLVLAICAAGIGGAIAWLGMRFVRVFAADRLPRLADAPFDVRTIVVAALAGLFAALIATVLSGVAVARVPLVETLKHGTRNATGGSARARRWFIAAELAMCVVLVAGAGLLVRSLSRQLGSATGFAAPNGLTFELTLPETKYLEVEHTTWREHPAASAFFTDVLDRMRRVPGVEAAAIGKPLPLSGGQEATVFTPEAYAPRPGEPTPIAQFTVASPDMFRALGTPMLAGREFNVDDRVDSPPVVIVNRAMADWLWPKQNAIGKRIRVGPPQMKMPAAWMTVVGVSADIKRYTLTETPKPEMIVPYTQNPYPSFLTMQFVVRSPLPAATLLPELQRAVAEVDRTVPIARARTIEDLVGETSATARFTARFMSAFGGVALLLAMIGVYGLVAFSVHQRRREFGVRRALGAAPAEVMGLVVRESLTLASAGVGVGIVLAVAAGFALRHLLYQVTSVDPIAFGTTIVLLATATVTASIAPAWRASRIEARTALEE